MRTVGLFTPAPECEFVDAAVLQGRFSTAEFACPERAGDYGKTTQQAQVDARGGLVCLNSAARFDKWNRAAVR